MNLEDQIKAELEKDKRDRTKLFKLALDQQARDRRGHYQASEPLSPRATLIGLCVLAVVAFLWISLVFFYGDRKAIEGFFPILKQVEPRSGELIVFAASADKSLFLYKPQLDRRAYKVIVNGADTTGPVTPFVFNWGDGTSTRGFFPQQKFYTKDGRYVAVITATHADGSHPSVKVAIDLR
jgi:hypothetical protein